MTNFTGERVIPGQVEPDLWAEHLSRYRFAADVAASLPQAPRVLDLGCGTGYGTALLAQHAASAVGLDLAPDAIAYARDHYQAAHLEFLAGSVTDVPLPDASCDLVTAFEVIEHIGDGARLLAEARRVLRPGGLLLVSTPNTTYYAETRTEHGPNPFHVREYTYEEFTSAVEAVFQHTAFFLQNHTDSFSFYDPSASRTSHAFTEQTSGSAPDAHFFLAACSSEPLPSLPNFIYVPVAANLLRTREYHIKLLLAEVERLKSLMENLKTDLSTAHDERDAMIRNFDSQSRDLEARTNWALQLDAEVKQLNIDLKKAVDAIQRAENMVIERTEWALQLDKERKAALAQLREIKKSSWLLLGRRLGLGPDIIVPADEENA